MRYMLSGLFTGAILYAIYVAGYIRGLKKSTQLHAAVFDVVDGPFDAPGEYYEVN